MRTLHVESGMHLYGGALQVVLLLQGLQRRGLAGVLACPPGSAVAAAARPYARVHEVPMRGDLDLGSVGRLRALIRAERPALVQLHSRRGSDLWGALAARREGVPALLSRRVDNPEPRWWVRRKYPLYARVVAISDGIRRVLIDQGVPAAQVVRIHDAIDTDAWRPGCADPRWLIAQFGLADDERTLAMAAQFIARKGHRTLLAALPAVLARHPRTRVLLFGRGPDEAAIRRAAHDAGLAERIVFAGFRDDLARILPCVDLLVHPASMEGLGVVLLQAAACGLPLVAGRAGGIPEVVRPGLNGELVEPGDAAALAAQLNRLLDDAALRARYGAAGRELVLREFSVDAMVERHIALYREIAAG